MEQKQAQAATPHVVFLASPFQGHIKPMLKLAELLSHASFQVTFINTEHVHERFIPSIDIQEFHRRFPNFQFLSIPDGLPLDNPRSLKHGLELLFSLRAVVKPELCQLLISLQSPTCIIADGLIISSAIDAGEEFGIPVFAFRTYSACSVWVYFHLSNLVEAGEVPFQEEDMDMLVTCIPGLENVLRRRDLPSLCRALKKDRITDNPLLEYFTSQALAMRRASALLLNTFDELERPMLSQLTSIFSKIYTIGPLHALSNVRIRDQQSSTLASRTSILWKEDRHCITWLDSQPPKSVVYVSFGSIVIFTNDQMLEFWHGLVNSGKPFLWVIRPDSIMAENDEPRKILKDLENRTKGKGLIVSWTPQEEVLAHWAIGGFLTHSGWNSTLESIYEGVPMICWPALGDQQVNSRFVSEVWKIGLDMKDTCDRLTIENMVRDLMEEKREEIMKSVNKIKNQAQQAVMEGGDSFCNLEKLIHDIWSMSHLAPKATNY